MVQPCASGTSSRSDSSYCFHQLSKRPADRPDKNVSVLEAIHARIRSGSAGSGAGNHGCCAVSGSSPSQVAYASSPVRRSSPIETFTATVPPPPEGAEICPHRNHEPLGAGVQLRPGSGAQFRTVGGSTPVPIRGARVMDPPPAPSVRSAFPPFEKPSEGRRVRRPDRAAAVTRARPLLINTRAELRAGAENRRMLGQRSNRRRQVPRRTCCTTSERGGSKLRTGSQCRRRAAVCSTSVLGAGIRTNPSERDRSDGRVGSASSDRRGPLLGHVTTNAPAARALPFSIERSRAAGVTPAGVEEPRSVRLAMAREDLQSVSGAHLCADADSLGMRGKQASAGECLGHLVGYQRTIPMPTMEGSGVRGDIALVAS